MRFDKNGNFIITLANTGWMVFDKVFLLALGNVKFGMANRFEYLMKSKKVVIATDLAALAASVLQLVAVQYSWALTALALIALTSTAISLFINKEYLSLQCDSALRNIVRIYPYDMAPDVDTTGDGIADEGSLRGSSEVVAARIRDEIQQKVAGAGLEILEARITYLAYAPEIAAVMLQRQQACYHRCKENDRGRSGRYGRACAGASE